MAQTFHTICRSCIRNSHLPLRISSPLLPTKHHASKASGAILPRLRRNHTRHYAVTRTPRKPVPNLELFSLSGIPLSSFEGVIAKNEKDFGSLTPGEYYSCVEKIVELVKKGSDPWSLNLLGKDGFPPGVIHNTACILRQISGPKSSDALATALWLAASDANYRPSTLSLARQLIRSGAYGKIPALKRVEARFKQLVSTARDPDALTAEGELLYEQGNYEAAIRVLQRALAVGAEEGFEWLLYCRLCLSKAYLRVGREEEARALLESLADAGLIEADLELGNMLNGSDDRESAEKHLYSAACSGRPDMFSRLAEMALGRAAEASGKEKMESLRWAGEWSKLADPKVEY